MRLDTKHIQNASHHIWGITPNGGVMQYHTNQSNSEVTIWSLRRHYKHLQIFFELWLKSNQGLAGSKIAEVAQMGKLLMDIEAGRSVDKHTLQRAAIGLLVLSPMKPMQFVQSVMNEFDVALTPQYRELIRKFDFEISPRQELILHAINPDVYLWIPEQVKTPQRALVVFPTKMNTLNMPRPMAHVLLTKLNCPIIYVGQRPNAEAHHGLLGMSYEQSAQFIKNAVAPYGITEFLGLGTSLGGFMACQMAQYMNFERLINFSGAQPEVQAKKNPIQNFCNNFDHQRVMSVLSDTDDVDKGIYQAYQRLDFNSPITWIHAKTHGSFTGAFMEDKLGDVFNWLVA